MVAVNFLPIILTDFFPLAKSFLQKNSDFFANSRAGVSRKPRNLPKMERIAKNIPRIDGLSSRKYRIRLKRKAAKKNSRNCPFPAYRANSSRSVRSSRQNSPSSRMPGPGTVRRSARKQSYRRPRNRPNSAAKRNSAACRETGSSISRRAGRKSRRRVPRLHTERRPLCPRSGLPRR